MGVGTNVLGYGNNLVDSAVKKVIQNDIKSRIKEVYGITTFDSEKEKYIILSGKDGTVEQWEINVEMDDKCSSTSIYCLKMTYLKT